MDDVPAGPASPEPRRPSLSVVVPVRNGGPDFERCLRRLRDSTWTDYELIVVDDGSTDDSAALARRMGAIVARHERPLGPAAARNLGAQLASAPLDLLPRRRRRRPSRDPGPRHGAVPRRSRASPPSSARTTTSRRPEAWSASTATCSITSSTSRAHFDDDTRPAHTFWTGCGMIRREVFLDFGGFDPRLYPRPAIEDIELGYRLTRAGHRIVLARDVLATHLKRWTLLGDGPDRHLPPRRPLDAPDQAERDHRDRPERQARPAALRGAHGPGPAGAAERCPGIPGQRSSSALGSAAIVWLNRDFYRFLGRRRGPGFALAALPVHCSITPAVVSPS